MPRITPVPKEKRTEPYWKDLNKIIDPELNIGLVDLGLIYDVKIKDSHAHVIMTLTSPGCPFGPMLLQQVEERMSSFGDIQTVEVDVVWDPVWNQEFMDQDIKDLMFGF